MVTLIRQRLLLLFAVFVGGSLELHLAFFLNGVLEALGTWEADPRFDTFTDAEDVTGAGREFVSSAILHVNDIERTGVSFFRCDDTNTTLIGTAGDHGSVSDIKFDDTSDLARSDIYLDGVAGFGKRVGVADSATVVSDNVRDGTSLTVGKGVFPRGSFASVGESFDAAQFEFAFFGVLDTVEDETAFVVVQQTVLFISVGNTNNVHETSGVVHVSADFAINFNKASHDDGLGLFAGQGILETVLQDEAHWETVSHFVRTGRRARGPSTTQFAQHPVLRSIQSF